MGARPRSCFASSCISIQTMNRLKSDARTSTPTKGELHPRNPHRAPYDFPRLIQSSPELKRFVQPHPLGGDTIDFSDPAGVAALNRALLKSHYNVARWAIPAGFLCPPIPSRADLLHYAADLLAGDNGSEIPRGQAVNVLDIGVGANCVYPLIGAHEYGWNFVGTDIDPAAVEWAARIVADNPAVAQKIECRLQPKADAIFKNVVGPNELFALSICNPPFHASAEEAASGTRRKLRNLGAGPVGKAVLNFGGRSNELWCEGGEIAFVRRMILESNARPEVCVWFTSLVSSRGSLPAIYRELTRAKAHDVRTIDMFAGQKKSRLVAWTFLPAPQRHARLNTA